MKKRDTIITSDNKIKLDHYLNDLKDGYPKYEVKKYKEGDYVTYQLIIRRLQLDDAGTYTCKIQAKGTSDDPQKEGLLIVLSKIKFSME